jgi:hypothetical protein
MTADVAMQRYLKYKRAGRCTSCGSRDLATSTRCEKCRARAAEAQAKRRAKSHAERVADGMCITCRRPHDGTTKECGACLSAHYARQKVLFRKRWSAGACRCGQLAVAKKYCLDCWFKNMANAHLRAKHFDVQLRQLWRKQNGKCAYTGLDLVPGENASLDHIVPRARGGADCIENLQWVTYEVNMAKRALSHAQFIDMCRVIAKRFTTEA